MTYYCRKYCPVCGEHYYYNRQIIDDAVVCPDCAGAGASFIILRTLCANEA